MHTRDQGREPFVRALTFTLHYTDVVDYNTYHSNVTFLSQFTAHTEKDGSASNDFMYLIYQNLISSQYIIKIPANL